jgi:hypothetical protein
MDNGGMILQKKSMEFIIIILDGSRYEEEWKNDNIDGKGI